MVSILVGTNDFRAALISTLDHACTEPELPGLSRIRLDIDRENVTVTATDRFTAAMAIVSVFTHLDPGTLEETDLPWVEVIDLGVDDTKKLLSIFKGGKENNDEPEFLLRIESTATHVTITDSSGLIDGRALKLPRLSVDEGGFPNLPVLFAKVHHGQPTHLENMAVGGRMLARFKAAAIVYNKSLLIEATTGSRSLTIRCGESFLGILMPVTLDEAAWAEHTLWREAWSARLPQLTGATHA